MSQILDAGGPRPPLRRRLAARAAVAAACLIAHLPPRRIRALLCLLRRGATAATYAQALAARQDVTATSVRCAGNYCLQRSLAAALLCRLRGSWPTWRTGVRMPPFAAHAWIEAEERPVGEPEDTITYRPLITVPPPPAV
ncbi:lasso peptide biosynthesis B2 protein [Streptomyces hoynatensis]|uniref:Lasso peptide biosynthesis B2 protein n=1 Tax=Streptomyces hoynatensis TaxID=1141874 RepID=A0A3A9ZAW7_9ACTN|nr:lasso peptide biosynthesis B2 protein [Streptomyces hoynatensis]RKN45602.1 lasso peptide biosynthesis B2 protein [Streptomyces hoynatensis]